MNKLTVGSGSDKKRVLSNSDIESVCVNSIKGCNELGDAIEEAFENNEDFMLVACKAWKE